MRPSSTPSSGHIGLPPPERLALPIISPSKDKTQTQPLVVQPTRLIHPLIDGYSRSYYEWAGAGFYRPGATAGSSMYQNAGVFLQLWHGFSLSELFLRLDPVQGADMTGELRILLTPPGGQDRALVMMVRPGGAPYPVRDEGGAQVGAGRCGALVELSLALSALGLSPADHARVVLRLVRGGVEVDRFPRYGELEMVVPDRSFERTHWHV